MWTYAMKTRTMTSTKVTRNQRQNSATFRILQFWYWRSDCDVNRQYIFTPKTKNLWHFKHSLCKWNWLFVYISACKSDELFWRTSVPLLADIMLMWCRCQNWRTLTTFFAWLFLLLRRWAGLHWLSSSSWGSNSVSRSRSPVSQLLLLLLRLWCLSRESQLGSTLVKNIAKSQVEDSLRNWGEKITAQLFNSDPEQEQHWLLKVEW